MSHQTLFITAVVATLAALIAKPFVAKFGVPV